MRQGGPIKEVDITNRTNYEIMKKKGNSYEVQKTLVLYQIGWVNNGWSWTNVYMLNLRSNRYIKINCQIYLSWQNGPVRGS